MNDTLEDIPTAHLEFDLVDGRLCDWLVLGPVAQPLDERVPELTPGLRSTTVRVLTATESGIVQPPAERATCMVDLRGGSPIETRWLAVQTGSDGLVDLASTYATPHYVCAWTYALLVAPSRSPATWVLTTCSPTEVWVNGARVHAHHDFCSTPVPVEFRALLCEGVNEVLIRTAHAGAGHLPMAVGLRLVGVDGVGGRLPTTLEPVARRQKLAAVMAEAYLPQAVYGRHQKIVLRWPTDMNKTDALTARLQTPAARIYAEAHPVVHKGSKVDFGEARQFPDGEYEVLLQPQFEEYYVQDLRVQRRLPLRIANAKWSSLYYGTPEARRHEALAETAKRKGLLEAEVAKAALGDWSMLRREVVDQALALIQKRGIGCERQLLQLLGMVARQRDLPDFPDDLGWAIEEASTQIAFESEPMVGILGAACQLLAGQLYADRTFADHHTGEWQRMQGEKAALAWLQQTTQSGMPEGESSAGLADSLVALSHLTDLAVADEIAELAAVAIDKLAFTMALATFQGTWGGPQEGAETPTLLAGGLSPLSGVCRLWWGQGAYTAQAAAAVALACAESYQLPELIAAAALDRNQEAWTTRQDVIQVDEELVARPRVAFRTQDYLLASAQGHILCSENAVPWQVTLGPDAILFGNHPSLTSEHDGWPANFWRGTRQPPQVAQWYDFLAVVYAPDAAALPLTHAYFPAATFDEVSYQGGWAFARKGDGYVAITATGGVTLTTKGSAAYKELVAAAPATWIVQMGRNQSDGLFTDFVARVLNTELDLNVDGVRFGGLRGVALEFGADRPLTVAGQAQNPTTFPHLHSPFGTAQGLPATSLDISYLDHVMRLDFGG